MKIIIKTDKLLKYFSIINFTLSPQQYSSPEIIKNRSPLLIIDDNKNDINEILFIPAEMEKILYGTGVKPAVKIIQKPCLSNFSWIFKKISSENKEVLNIK